MSSVPDAVPVQFLALCAGLEIPHPIELWSKHPVFIEAVGAEIAEAAKLGADEYVARVNRGEMKARVAAANLKLLIPQSSHEQPPCNKAPRK